MTSVPISNPTPPSLPPLQEHVAEFAYRPTHCNTRLIPSFDLQEKPLLLNQDYLTDSKMVSLLEAMQTALASLL